MTDTAPSPRPAESDPAGRILEYLETHESLNTKEAEALVGFPPRGVLNALVSRGMLKPEAKAGRGGARYSRGRQFSRWREWQANGFQTDVLTGRQFELPGFGRGSLPSSR